MNNGPFDERTVLEHLNTELVCYSDPHCNLKIEQFTIQMLDMCGVDNGLVLDFALVLSYGSRTRPPMCPVLEWHMNTGLKFGQAAWSRYMSHDTGPIKSGP